MIKIVSVVYLISLCVLVGCTKQESEVANERLRPVSTMVVKAGQMVLDHSFSGVVKAERQARLSFAVGGTLESINLQVGQSLKQGQVVATLHKEEFLLELKKAEASLEQSIAKANNALQTYNRIEELFVKGTVSRVERDNAIESRDATDAQVNQAQRQVDLAAQKLADTELKLEQDNCQVASVSAEEGENIGVGTTIATINCGDHAVVDVSVPETFVGMAKSGSSVQVSLNAFPGVEFSGKVFEVGVDAIGTIYPVTIALEPTKERILPGMAATVQFSIPVDDTEQISLPLFVAQSDAQGTFVYVVNPETSSTARLERREIVIDIMRGGKVRVLSGVEDGEVVVTKGISHLHDEMLVRFNSQQQ